MNSYDINKMINFYVNTSRHTNNTLASLVRDTLTSCLQMQCHYQGKTVVPSPLEYVQTMDIRKKFLRENIIINDYSENPGTF